MLWHSVSPSLMIVGQPVAVDVPDFGDDSIAAGQPKAACYYQPTDEA